MAGGIINTTLTLNALKFNEALDKAATNLSEFDTKLSAATKVSAAFDKNIDGLGKGLSGVADKFKLLDQTVNNLVSKLAASAEKIAGVGKATSSAKKSIDELNVSTRKVNDSISAITKGSEIYRNAIAALDPAIRRASTSYLELSAATESAAKASAEGANISNKARLKSLEAELSTNAKIITERKALVAELAALEEKLATSSNFTNKEASRYFGKNAAKSAPIRTEAEQYANEAQAIKAQSISVQGLIKELEWKNAEITKSIELTEREATVLEMSALKARAAAQERIAASKLENDEQKRLIGVASGESQRMDKQNIASFRSAMDERKRIGKEVTDAEMAQASQISSMWKGMAALWAASKIESGLVASVKASDDYSRVVERMDAAGVGGAAGRTRTLAIAKQVEDSNLNLSKTDALKLTMSGVAGTVSTDTKSLGTIMPEIAKVLTVMTRQFPEQAHNLEDFGRNVMGVMEARGITSNPARMLSTLDNLSRALIMTQGKMSVQDYETISRRGGPGNAQLKNDESILYDVAGASQMKVMGGGTGGGAGGVSTYATMLKMAENRATGGTKETISGTKNLIEMGIIDGKALMAANGGKAVGKNYTPVAYKNADQAADNMTKFAMDLVNNVKAKLKALPETDTRYFAKGADRSDDAVIAKAFAAWSNQTFGNTNTKQFYQSFGTNGSQSRINAEVQASKEAPNYDKAHEEVMKSWGLAVDQTKASLEKLGVVVGDVLIPILQPLLGLVTGLTNALRAMSDSPIAAGLTAIALSFGGIALGLSGLSSLFGLPSLFNKVTVSGGEAVTKIGLLGRVGTGVAGDMLKGFGLLSAFLIGWDIGIIASKFEVAGLSIGEHMQNVFNDIASHWRNLMLMFKSGDQTAAFAASEKLRKDLVIAPKAQTIDKRIADNNSETERFKNYKDAGFTGDLPGLNKTIAAHEAVNKSLLAEKAAIDKVIATKNAPAKAIADKATKDKKIKEGELASRDTDPTKTHSTDGIFKAPKEAPRDMTDFFERWFATLQGKVAKDTLKLGTVESGKTSYDEQAKAAFVAEWKAGNLDKGHQAQFRPFMNANVGGKMGKDGWSGFEKNKDNGKWNDEANLNFNDPKAKDSIALINQGLKVEAETKAEIYAKERYAAVLSEITESTIKQTAAMRALNRDFATQEAGNPIAGTLAKDKNSQYSKDKVGALTVRATEDANLSGEKIVAETAAINAKLKTDAEGLLLTKEQLLGKEFDAKTKAYKKDYDVEIEWLNKQIKAEENANLTNTDNYKNAVAQRNKLTNDLADYEVAREKLKAVDIQSPLAKQVEQWKNSFNDIEQAQASWADQMMKGIEKVTDGGFKNFKDFKNGVKSLLAGMMTDVSHMLMQKAIGGMVGSIAGGLGDMAKSLFKTAGGDGGDSGASKPDGTSSDPIYTKSVDSTSLTDGLTSVIPGGANSTSGLSGLLSSFGMGGNAGGMTGGLGSMFGMSGMGGMLSGLPSIISSMFSGAGSFMDGGVAMAGLTDASLLPSLTDGGGGIMDSIMSMFSFANGGIMTNMGAIELKKYAKGGIANSPQLALFGEAGPEAYVPLPDGRSIPVQMKGGAKNGSSNSQSNGGETININITVNQTGGSADSTTTSSGAGADQFKSMANTITAVVRQELITQRRPGGLLYK